MVDIRNEQSLKAVLTEVLVEVINEMSDEIRERLVKHIQAYTYFPLPNRVYEGGSGEPSYEFEQSYTWRGVKMSLGQVTNELYNNWSQMTIDQKTGRHYENGKDMRKKLADLLNVDGVFGRKKRKPYWDLFLAETDKTIDDRFKNKLKKMGFNIV
jgi:hypothetical protein